MTCAALSIANLMAALWMLTSGDGAAPPAAALPPSRSPATSKEAEPYQSPVAVDLAQYRSILDRPLFWPSRRPPGAVAAEPDQPVVAAVPPPPAEPGVRVVGTMITAGRRLALLRQGAGERWLEQGSVVGGWTIAMITTHEVLLTAGDLSRRLKVYQGKER